MHFYFFSAWIFQKQSTLWERDHDGKVLPWSFRPLELEDPEDELPDMLELPVSRLISGRRLAKVGHQQLARSPAAMCSSCAHEPVVGDLCGPAVLAARACEDERHHTRESAAWSAMHAATGLVHASRHLRCGGNSSECDPFLFLLKRS